VFNGTLNRGYTVRIDRRLTQIQLINNAVTPKYQLCGYDNDKRTKSRTYVSINSNMALRTSFIPHPCDIHWIVFLDIY